MYEVVDHLDLGGATIVRLGQNTLMTTSESHRDIAQRAVCNMWATLDARVQSLGSFVQVVLQLSGIHTDELGSLNTPCLQDRRPSAIVILFRES